MKFRNFALLSLITLLTACGGGGGGSPATGPVASTLSFPLQTGYKALIASGLSTKSFTVSGTCTGSGSKTSAPANTPATFEGVSGLSAVGTLTMTLTNCTPASTAQTYTSYFDSNYVQLGFNSVGINYGVFLIAPNIPTSAAVGGTGVIGTMTFYTDSTKSVGNGREDLSYLVETDTATTAIVNLIAKVYNASGTLTATEQDRYRIDSVGTLTPVSADIQAANGSTTHLVLTF
jgi:hypothetical protein